MLEYVILYWFAVDPGNPLAKFVPCMAAVWLLMKPEAASPSTFAIFGALVLATGAIVINTWHNAQATTNTSHVIYATETARKDS